MRYNAQSCEHEAAHAVVARELGLQVEELRVDHPKPNTDGHCLYRATGLQNFENSVVLAAPLLWFERFRYNRYPAGDEFGSTFDQQNLTRAIHALADDIDEALLARKAIEHTAARLLQENASDVLAIAMRLQEHGVWTRGSGWAA